MSTLSVSDARAALPHVLDRVEAGEEVTITRHGRAVAVVVRPDTLRVRRAADALASAATVEEVLERGRAAPLPSRPAVAADRAEALLDEVRAGRSR